MDNSKIEKPIVPSEDESLLDQVLIAFAAELATPLSEEHLLVAQSEADDLDIVRGMWEKQMEAFRLMNPEANS
jgi:hypothetical protein